MQWVAIGIERALFWARATSPERPRTLAVREAGLRQHIWNTSTFTPTRIRAYYICGVKAAWYVETGVELVDPIEFAPQPAST